MAKPILCGFLFALTTALHAQPDTVKVILMGGVTDTHFGKPVANAWVEVVSTRGHTTKAFANDSGLYVLEIPVPGNMEGVSLAILCWAEGMLTAKDHLWLKPGEPAQDTMVHRDFGLQWGGPCVDTFAPGKIHLGYGEACIPDSLLPFVKDWIPTAIEITNGATPFKVMLRAAVGYDEPRALSRRRIACMRRTLLEYGLPDSAITSENYGRKTYFHCRYCEGCVPSFLLGTGDTLSRETIRNSPNGKELNNLRRMVELSFVHPDAGRMKRKRGPVLR